MLLVFSTAEDALSASSMHIDKAGASHWFESCEPNTEIIGDIISDFKRSRRKCEHWYPSPPRHPWNCRETMKMKGYDSFRRWCQTYSDESSQSTLFNHGLAIVRQGHHCLRRNEVGKGSQCPDNNRSTFHFSIAAFEFRNRPCTERSMAVIDSTLSLVV